MKKQPETRSMDRLRTGAARQFGMIGIASMLVPALLIASCTNYRPIDQGARVPWAKALASNRGGPIDDNRYRVGEGDALSRIADRYGVRMQTLAAANNIEAPYVLYPGEVLRIPPDVPLPTRKPDTAPAQTIVQTDLPAVGPAKDEAAIAAARAPGPEAPEPTIEAEEPGRRHVVAQGESLSHVAARYGLRLGDLVAANDIDPPYDIAPGQTLVVPPSEADYRQLANAGDAAAAISPGAVEPPPPLSREGFIWPVDGELIGSFEDNSAVGRSGGVNIAARKGTPVRAADNGVVAYAGEALSGYGRMVMIRHDQGYVTLYAHNDVMHVREGDIVWRGQTIAEVGDSGDVEESQLHFELRKGAAPVDPVGVLAGLPGRQVGTL